jgi:hypothetical protein
VLKIDILIILILGKTNLGISVGCLSLLHPGLLKNQTDSSSAVVLMIPYHCPGINAFLRDVNRN